MRANVCHLRASLEGEAGQVLWTDGELNSVEDVIQLLRNRFGNQDQRERYRAELKTIRRRDGASLQSVYNEVRRVMALAFPGERGALWEVLARDAFLDALDDESVRQRILEKDPPTLDAALKIACHLEAIRRPTPPPTWDDNHRRDRLARGVVSDQDGRHEMDKRLQQLETALRQHRQEVEQCRAENAWLRQSAAAAPTDWTTPPPAPSVN